MRLREIRFLTASIIIVAGLMTASKGWSIAHFSSVRSGFASPGYPAETIRAWTSVRGLASAVLEAALSQVESPNDLPAARGRRDQLIEIVSVKPLSSVHWLSLAGAWLVTGQPVDKIATALSLSSVTGPNEGFVMLRRGIFGLVQWEKLPENIRAGVITDLAAPTLAAIVPDRDAGTAKTLLAMKPPETREEIRRLLVAQGLTPGDLARIGL
jgi:hypothetical protein